MTDWLNTKIVKDQKPAGPLTVTTPKGTVITQKNDSVWDWENWPNHGQIITGSNPRGTYYVYRGTGDPEEMKTMSPESLQKYLYFIQQAKPRNAWYDRARQKVTDWLGNNEKVQEEQNGGLLEGTFNGVTNIANSALGATNTVVNGAGQIAGSTANLVDTGVKGTSGLLGGIFGALSAPFQLATAAAQRKIQDIRSSEEGGKIQKGEDGMIAGEFPPTWNQGEIRQGFQKARPKLLQKIQDVADDLNNRPDKYGPLSMILGPAARYITGQGGYEDMAAILPGIGAANTAGKVAVGKSAQLEKEIENAFKAKGLREQMAKWDQELITNADRNIIKPSLLDELTTLNTQYIKEIDPNLISGSTEPPLLGALMLGSGVGTVGGGLYLVTKGKTKKKNKPSQTTIEDKNKKQHGGRLMRQGGRIIEVPFEK